MSKNVRTLLIIIMGLLALTTVVGFIYGSQNKGKTNNIYSSYDETIINAVNNAVEECQNAFDSVEADQEQMTSLNEYITNIDEAESPVLKAYIADSMLTFAGDSIMIMSQNYIAGVEGAKSFNYDHIQKKLFDAKSQLSAARNYNTQE